MRPWHALVGVGKQSAKGANGAATYGFGISDGGVHRLELEQNREEVTLLRRAQGDVIRTSAVGGAAFTTRLFPRPLPLFLYGALGTIATTGGAPPYTHTITPGTDLPYLHIFGRQDNDYADVRDCRVGSVGIKWDGAGRPELAIDMIGLVPRYGTSWTPTNDDSLADPIPTISGTFQVDVDGTTLAVARIKAGEITVENALSPTMLAKSVLPDDVGIGPLEISCGLTIIPTTSLADWRSIVTGTPSGTAVAETPVYGSANLVFTLDANTDLTVDLDRIAFQADWPDADPSSSDELELVLEGTVLENDASNAISFIVRNNVASY